jgi:hypothetical protein
MPTTEYEISHRGHNWTVSGPNAADIAQHYQGQGATITAEMKSQQPNGINIKQLSKDELENLSRIAEAEDWGEISHMVRNEWQTRL